MIVRCSILFILTVIIPAGSQAVVEETIPVCAAPLLPQPEKVDAYFRNLQKNNPQLLQKLSLSPQEQYEVGEERTFNVLNLENRDVVKFDQVVATLQATNKGINIWVSNSEMENGHVTEPVIQDVLNGLTENTPQGSLFPDQGIVEIEHSVFGMPPDIDDNGTVEFLLCDIKDGWEETGGFVGGFFYSRDQRPSASGSNKADLMYIDTYPGIYRESNGNVTREPSSVLGTVAHEYQHLIQYKNDPGEEDFVNEGLSEIASFLCGYGLRNPSHYLRSTDISLIDFEGSDFDKSLNHYSKVALFTFFLYEQFGLDYITSLSMNENSGVTGVDAALSEQGADRRFNDLVISFFKTLVTNNPDIFPEFAFQRDELKYLQAKPVHHITEVPSSQAVQIRAYSLNMLEITNIDSLSVFSEGAFFGELYQNSLGYSDNSYLNNLSFPYTDPSFGTDDHTLQLIFMNNSNTVTTPILDFDGNERSYLFSAYEGQEEADFFIVSDGNVNATSFEVTYDSTLLKSVSFNNGESGGRIRIHVYQESIDGKSSPASHSILLENALPFEWVHVNVENLSVIRDRGQVFEVGIEYLDKGSMGYSDVNGDMSRSYLRPRGSVFSPLDRFEISGGRSLDGLWMIDAEMAAPLRNKPAGEREGALAWATLGPTPFRPAEHGVLNIGYTYEGDNKISLEIFNILGERIFKTEDRRGAELIQWDGNNNAGHPAASGTYFLRLGSKNQVIHNKIIVLR